MTVTQPPLECCNGRATGRRGVRFYVARLAVLWLLTWVVGCTPVAISGLRPEYPEARLEFAKVDSLQPTLRWEVFPRSQDRGADREGLLGRIGNVTYDVKIWRADVEGRIEYPAEVAYSRRGLQEPWHKIEEPLKPSTKYFWSIRARFELDGHPKVTQWGVMENPYSPGVARSPLVPNPLHYRFKTPSE